MAPAGRACTAPFIGMFGPASGLAAMNGVAANGTWTLRTTDVAGGAVGF